MTVAVSRVTVTHDDHGHKAHIAVHGDSVTVEWNCGDTRRFTAEDAREHLRNIRAALEEAPGAWYVARDSDGSVFAVTILDGDLYADTHTRDEPGSLAHVDWREFRRTVKQTLRSMKEPVAA